MTGKLDAHLPNLVRIYDYYLGGKANFAADREAPRLVLGAAPDVPLAELENREFLKRAIRYLAAERGISQFAGIGPGLPAQGNAHQLACQHNPGARVAHADNDPGVLAHGKRVPRGVQDVTIIAGDLQEPDRILAEPDLAALIDFSHPVALFMTLVLHFASQDNDPCGLAARYRDALCPGSFLVLSHVTGDGREPGMLTGASSYENANAPLTLRTRRQVEQFFSGFSLIEPGVVFLPQWHLGGEYHAQGRTRWAYRGVSEKP